MKAIDLQLDGTQIALPDSATERLIQLLADPESLVEARRRREVMRSIGGWIVCLGDAEYPADLAATADPPVVLFGIGEEPALHRAGVAIVGSRRCSVTSRRLARSLGQGLAAAGLTVVSGGARGVDTFAHEGCIDAGGTPVLVVARAPDEPGTAAEARLCRAVLDAGGVLASELPPGAAAQRWSFPRRNRILSGLSQGTVVVEAAGQSGSLHTARAALRQGRPLMAVPGTAGEARHAGSNRLIREGATLVESAADILGTLGIAAPASADRDPAPPDLEPGERAVLELLEVTPLDADAIAARAALPPSEALAALTTLELRGLAAREAGNRYLRVRRR